MIICDSSDPVGPAEVLFQPEFFLSMRDALAPGGEYHRFNMYTRAVFAAAAAVLIIALS